MKACTKSRCFMAGQCCHFEAYLKATITDKPVVVEFADLYKPDDEGKCLNFEFKTDIEKIATDL